MEKIIDFFLEINRLKELPRRGWVLMKIKNPETIAEHIFRLAFAAWFLGREKKLNIKKLIRLSLVHDLGEIYSEDKTPFFYWDKLNRSKKEDEKILLKGVRLSQKEKEKRAKIKFLEEKKSFLKLISLLKESLRKELFSLWLDYEKKLSKEGKFIKQVDRIELLLQAIEYFDLKKSKGGTSWWELTEEIVEDPLLLDFLKIIQRKFYKKISGYKNNTKLEEILNLLLKIGRLKRMNRAFWKVLGIKKAETVAEHIFTVTLLAWILGREKTELDQTKILKMALCHEVAAIFLGDSLPYLGKLKLKINPVKKKWEFSLLAEDEKARYFLKQYNKEKTSVLKLLKKTEPGLKKEIFNLWQEYRQISSLEAIFLNQINALALLIQGLYYQKKYKISIKPLWHWVIERCSDPIILYFMDKLHQKFSFH